MSDSTKFVISKETISEHQESFALINELPDSSVQLLSMIELHKRLASIEEIMMQLLLVTFVQAKDKEQLEMGSIPRAKNEFFLKLTQIVARVAPKFPREVTERISRLPARAYIDTLLSPPFAEHLLPEDVHFLEQGRQLFPLQDQA